MGDLLHIGGQGADLCDLLGEVTLVVIHRRQGAAQQPQVAVQFTHHGLAAVAGHASRIEAALHLLQRSGDTGAAVRQAADAIAAFARRLFQRSLLSLKRLRVGQYQALLLQRLQRDSGRRTRRQPRQQRRQRRRGGRMFMNQCGQLRLVSGERGLRQGGQMLAADQAHKHGNS